MKNSLKSRAAVLAVFCVLFATPQLPAQEWNAAQKEVWKNVQAYWELGAKQDLEGMLAYFHPDYSGWGNEDALPSDKASLRKWIEHDFKTRKTLVYDIKPAAIKIHGNTAIVHYYFSDLIKETDGKEKTESGRWTDVLLKQGDKWLLIGDHGGKTSKD